VTTRTIEQIANRLANTVYNDDGHIKIHWPYSQWRRRGLYRYVLIKNKVAYKISRFVKEDHNIREWRFYFNAPEELRPLLAKPLYITPCHGVMAMEYIPILLESCEVDHLEAANHKIRSILRHYYDHDQVWMLTSDNHGRNLGMVDGQYKWIDYATGYTALEIGKLEGIF